MRITATRSLSFAAMLLSAACAGADGRASGALAHQIDTIRSFERVRSVGAAPVWTIEERFVVGSAGMGEVPAPDEFGRIASVAVSADGRLFVADAANGEIVSFAADGSVLGRFGRTGQGPGEFGRLSSLALLGDRLLALDFRNGRVAELSLEGEWLGSRPAPGSVSGPASLLRFYPAAGGGVHQWSVEAADGDLRRVWVVQDSNGVVDQWPQPTLTGPAPQSLVCPRPDDAIQFFDVPFGGRMLSHPARRRFSYAAWSATPAIALIGVEGDTVRLIERPHDPVALTDQEWQAATADFETFREEWPTVVCEPRSIERPESKPALAYLMVDPDGRLWVERYTADGTAWEVFDGEGRLIGTLAGFDYTEDVPPTVRGEAIAWVSLDELEVQRVHVGVIRPLP